MSDSNRFQALMLEQLYGLLEPDEVRELENYLNTPEGASLRTQAEGWKSKIEDATHLRFPNFRFNQPTDKQPLPTVRPAPEKKTASTLRISNVWSRWAVAACLLVVLGGLGGPALYQFGGWYVQSQETKSLAAKVDSRRSDVAKIEQEHRVARDAVQQEFARATAAHQEAHKSYLDAQTKAKEAIEDKDFVVRLRGPDRIQPGAPNEWQIDTLTKQGGYGMPKKVEVVVRDQKNEELLRETHGQSTGSTLLKLPTSFWEKVKPGSDLFLEVIAYADDNRKSVIAERVPLARPIFVTHLVTDKPLYKPGEIVRYRSLTLDRATFLPPEHDQHLEFRLRNSAGALIPREDGNGRVMIGLKPVMGPDGKPLRGIGTGEYELPADSPGGEYSIEVAELNTRKGSETILDVRKFLVNRYVPDIFEKKLEFDGKSYGPGDVVQARVEVSRTQGGPMNNATAVVEARIGATREIFTDRNARFQIVADQITKQPKAVLNVRFTLPKDLLTNVKGPVSATLSVTVLDGSDGENIVRPIPLVERDLRVEFFPEGGDLVEGVSSRVYFQVLTPNGKPADIKGTITDGTNTVAQIATMTDPDQAGVNRGQGVFAFKPLAGKKYFLKLSSPTGITEPTRDGFPLPETKPDGIVLRALDAVTEKAEAIRVQLETGKGPKVVHVGAYARGRLISHQRVELAAGKPVDVKLQGDEEQGGVTRITVFEEAANDAAKRVAMTPRAERLVYRKPGTQLILSANPDKSRYSPAAKVALELAALNEKEQATPAILLVGVVNQSVIAMADNKTDHLLPTHFLLAGEVKNPSELEHADFLLTDHPKAGVALDVLLGTQGWRRFAEQNILPTNPVERREVERMLVAHGRRTTAPLELYRLEEQRINSEFVPKLEQSSQRKSDAQVALNQFQSEKDVEFRNKVASARAGVAAAEAEHRTSAATLYQFETRSERARTWALPCFLLGLLALAVGAVGFAIVRRGPVRRRSVATAAGSFALGILVLSGVVLTQGTPSAENAYAQAQETRARTELPYANRATATKAMPPAAMPDRAVEKMDFAPVIGAADPRALPPAPKFDPVEAPGGPVKKPAVKRGQVADLKLDKGRMRGNDRAKEEAKVMAPAIAEVGPGEAVPGGPPPIPPGGEVDNQFASTSFAVREYAHRRDPSLGSKRENFTETVYWHPVLVLPDSGRATVEFQLSDDIARYQILVAGHTVDGRVGAITKTIEARKPFTVDPKLPLEISHTDTIDVPVRVVNDSDDRRVVSFTVNPSNLSVEGGALKTPEGLFKDSIDLETNGKGRKIFRVKPTMLQGQAGLDVIGNSDPAAEPDSVRRMVSVVPDGFPGVGSFSDMLEKRATGSVTLPKDIVKGSLKVRLEVYPTSMADLVKGLDGLLREPGGCFEQTSTSNYPNTLILDYLNQTNQTNPEAAKRAKEMLDRGYAKLTSFECPDTPAKTRQGFEWFGAADMAHEALTAYGLLQFKDMARVHKVDAELIKRTQAFLLSRRDGSGGFKRNAAAIDQFGGAPEHTTNAYIVWALVESDLDDAEQMDLKKEIAALKQEALKEDSRGGKDAYFLAITANILLQRGDRETAIKLLDRLKEKNFKDGGVTGAETSITRSGGRDLQIETTALAMLGWLRANDNKYAATIKDATKWISQQRGGYGGFGSTQSTILALKALILFAKKTAHPSESGEIKLLVGGKPVATRAFSEKDVEVIGVDIDKAEELFAAGKTEVEIVTDAKHPYPFALSYTYTTLTPVSSDKCAVKLETKLARKEANEGETVPLSIALENQKKEGHGMVVAIVGLPAGMKVPTDMKQLTDLREKGVISFFETRGRELVLYWRSMAPEQKVSLTIDLVCDVPGEYRGPASRGYLYYNADDKHWVEPLAIRIHPMTAKDGAVAGK
jgi:hypothetical protein